MNTKIYKGIYTKKSNKITDAFLVDEDQIQADLALLPFYLWETIAHNYMLGRTNIIPEKQNKKILHALVELFESVENNSLLLDPEKGDVHENIESLLIEKLGNDAGWMHIARSRNDQITCDQKLLTKHLFYILFKSLTDVTQLILEKSQEYNSHVMPGYTHARIAMPSSYGFWLQSFAVQFLESEELLQHCFIILDKNPLGAGASYGVNWKIDTSMTTELLGFGTAFTNALAAINSRGMHEGYFLGILTTLLTIISRMMEDIIFFSMPEIGFVKIDEDFTTGSSIMPQKMNPDIAEKIRSKAANMLGQFVTIQVIQKGLMSGYNRDSAGSKVITISALTETTCLLKTLASMLQQTIPQKEIMENAVIPSLATKLADAVSAEVIIPFRQAHIVIGSALRKTNHNITNLTNKILEQTLFEITGKRIIFAQTFLSEILAISKTLDTYSYKGSPNPSYVFAVSKELKEKNLSLKKWGISDEKKFNSARKNLLKTVKTYVK